MISLCTDLFKARLKKVEDKMGIGERNGYSADNNQGCVSKRNISRNLLIELSKKPKVLEKQGGPLEGIIVRGGEGYFFHPNKNPEEIYKIFIKSVEVKEDYIEVDVLKVGSTDYKHKPEDKNKTTWGKIRI